MNVRSDDEMLRLSAELNRTLAEVEATNDSLNEDLVEIIKIDKKTNQPMIVGSEAPDRLGKVLELRYYQDLLTFKTKSEADKAVSKKPTRKLIIDTEASMQNTRFVRT